CSVYFVRDAQHLINTFSSNPEYLKTKEDDAVKNYKDWGIPLGRRFRALKLWFVMRSFGVEGLQNKIREHIRITNVLYDLLKQDSNWEIMAPFVLNVLCIRFHPSAIDDNAILNNINEDLLRSINATGKYFLSGTKLHDKFVIRIVPSQTNVREEHVTRLYQLMCELTNTLR
ncbi:MAG: aspartate aminotransferase family protein, partial [Chitinophagales bacterium]|nr:aspartate aminotransferase family protein [Chitinophagales bacterium]